jgi:dTMP kinase
MNMEEKKERRGKFIVIEGTDGSGKATQTALLLQRLKESGYSVETIDFPRHGEDSGKLVDLYLTGFFGDATKLDSKFISGFYAIDRLMNKPKINAWLDEGKIVIADRYTSSNIGHQGAKVPDDESRKKLFIWINRLEFEEMKIPRPDEHIFLHVPAEIAFKLVEKKSRRKYTLTEHKDLHEKNLEHLKAAEKSYLHASNMFNWKVIECTENGELLTMEQIHEKVWQEVSRLVEKQEKLKI